MAERYEKLFSSYDKFYSMGSPALIVAEALLKDTKEDKVKAQLKFQNISNKRIKAVNIGIKAYDSFGRELQGIEEYQYADLSVYQGEYWGQDKAITLPNDLTRTIKGSIRSVVFQDNTIWESESNVWNKLSEPKKLYSLLLDDELVKQYKLEYGDAAEYVYLEEEGIWHCTCGAINQLSVDKCYHCRASKDAILSCDLDVLKANADARVAKEKAEADEKARIKAEEEEKARIAEKERLEREEAKRKKRNKILMITVPIVVVIITFIALTPNVIKPALSYNKALKLLEEGSFDDAQIAFQELGDYKDSSSKALDSQYKKAEKFFNENRYEEAIEVWNSLGDFSNSKERILITEETRNEKDYQEAISLMDEQNFVEATEIFKRLGDYKDSYKKAIECVESQKETDYQSAKCLVEQGEYKIAIDEFEKLKEYKDSKELYNATSYTYACKLMSDKLYLDAIDYFERTNGYDDVELQILEAKYAHSVLYKTSSDKSYYFLKELSDLKYSDAQRLYKELYDWKVEVSFLSDTESLKNIVTSRNKNSFLALYIQIMSGPIDEKLPVKLVITYPNGEIEAGTYGGNDGQGFLVNESFLKIWENGVEGRAGTLKVRVEDGNGNTVGYGSIKITD